MKYAVLIGDGMADYPVKELNGMTPVEAAKTPNMDWIAQMGSGGRAVTVPKGMTPGSDVANMSIFGFEPEKYYSGRGPLEAASMNIELKAGQIAFRCNFVTVSDGIMVDYSASHISSNEGAILINILNEELAEEGVKFYAGISYRNLMVIEDDKLTQGRGDLHCTPPHDITGRKIKKYLPKGRGQDKLRQLMQRSVDILVSHEINKVKLDLKENSANMIWLWGQGKKPNFPPFEERFGKKAGIISAVDLLKGMGKSMGMEVIEVPGATGYYDTDYTAKAEYAIDALNRLDIVFVHVEAPDEAGHNGDLRNKVLAITNFDNKIVGPVIKWLKSQNEYRIMTLPDHPTPLSLRTHTSVPVPFAICGKGIAKDAMEVFSEKEALKGGFGLIPGAKVMRLLIEGSNS